MKVLVEKNPIMKEIYDKYNKFVKNDDLTEGYTEWEENYFRMLTLSEERLQGKLEGIREGVEKGKLEGIKEGIKERNYTIAKDMKSKNMDIKLISEITGLTIEEISKL